MNRTDRNEDPLAEGFRDGRKTMPPKKQTKRRKNPRSSVEASPLGQGYALGQEHKSNEALIIDALRAMYKWTEIIAKDTQWTRDAIRNLHCPSCGASFSDNRKRWSQLFWFSTPPEEKGDEK